MKCRASDWAFHKFGASQSVAWRFWVAKVRWSMNFKALKLSKGRLLHPLSQQAFFLMAEKLNWPILLLDSICYGWKEISNDPSLLRLSYQPYLLDHSPALSNDHIPSAALTSRILFMDKNTDSGKEMESFLYKTPLWLLEFTKYSVTTDNKRWPIGVPKVGKVTESSRVVILG